jgi:hypothetical protein
MKTPLTDAFERDRMVAPAGIKTLLEWANFARSLENHLFTYGAHTPVCRGADNCDCGFSEVQKGLPATDDHKRLVRELDVLLNGDSAAPQASLCDIVAQVRKYSERLQAVLADSKPDFLALLKEVSDRALDNMEGEDAEGFNRWEKVHTTAEDLIRAIAMAEGRTKQDKHG